ncbi:hypothetical protein Tco_1469528, partial [Tanacetum coccineum]
MGETMNSKRGSRLLLRQLKLLEFGKFTHLVLAFLFLFSSYKQLSGYARLALVVDIKGEMARDLALAWLRLCINGYVYFTHIRADERRRHVEFEVGDQVMVKLLPQQFK